MGFLNWEAGRVYRPVGSEGASWDIMRCQAADQVVRTVEMRRWGGRDRPQRSLVRVVTGFELELDILTVGRWWRSLILVFAGARGKGMGEPKSELVLDILFGVIVFRRVAV